MSSVRTFLLLVCGSLAYRDSALLHQKQCQQLIGMKSKTILIVLLSLFCAVAVFGQAREGGRGQGGGRGRGLTKPPATDKVTPEISGVVKAGTKMEIVNTTLGCTDAGLGMPDGSILASCRPTVTKIAPDGTTTTVVENSDQAAGLTIDPRGRIIG